ncbi:DUF115 domain-containing protein [Colwellia sp. 1_MG-2023]|uniref:motility associated factor glycosyltransferase family protein n=1 Tax=Colwellia sp. 1_MG-2023 TaxID=3062649 RepID=UPI0026E18A8F|nr:6-hydroxymethylpterin diphosphokinase MptE-like protein [Colwellia sp. 1_MG-2023]MDO6444395.1 DUF115 domain-containing protein [Colwellia sp. 1_MG-2023]
MDSLEKNFRDVENKLEQLQEKLALEEVFSEQANKRFEQNIRAFEKYFPDIYQRFVSYSPQENFQLEVNPDGTGNIIDYDTKVPMYSNTPIEQVKQQVKETLAAPELSRVDFSSVEFIEDTADFLHVRLMNQVGASYNKAKNTLEDNVLVCKAIPSKVIFGIGLGYHLMPLIEETKASYITIFEPNEDYFFASLFCFDWKGYLKKVDEDGSYLYLGIGDSEEDMYQTLYQRAKSIGAFSISNSFFYLHYKSQSIFNLVTKIKNNFHQFFMGWGFFDDALMSVAHSIGVAKKNPNLLNFEDTLPKFVEQYPVFIVANGPSLDNDIEFIKQYKEKVIIVACNSASTALLSHGICPDFHVALERTKETYDLLEAVITEEQRQNINLLVLNVMYPDVLDLFGWSGIALKGSEPGTVLYQLGYYLQTKKLSPTIGFSNPLVGNTALSFFSHLGFSDIYLFGVDNGYVDEEHHHSKSSFYYDEEGNSKLDSIKMGAEFEVDGNFGKKVITEPFLFTGKEQMERLISSFAGKNLQCYNCSDGAKVEGAIPLRSTDIFLEKQSYTKAEIINYIKSNSFKKVDEPLPLEALLAFDVFDKICATMIEILEAPMNNRSDALKNIMTQLRYLFSFKQEEQYLHLYLILEGETLYINSVLLSVLFNFGDEKTIMPFFEEALSHWIEFLKIAPQQYRERWDVLSDHDFIFTESK